MGKENLKNFFGFLNANKDASIVAQAIGSNIEAFIAFGREKGFIFSVEDIAAFSREVMQSSKELTDAELEMAAGGTGIIPFLPGIQPSNIPIIVK